MRFKSSLYEICFAHSLPGSDMSEKAVPLNTKHPILVALECKPHATGDERNRQAGEITIRRALLPAN